MTGCEKLVTSILITVLASLVITPLNGGDACKQEDTCHEPHLGD
jgi:hypothetical protein